MTDMQMQIDALAAKVEEIEKGETLNHDAIANMLAHVKWADVVRLTRAGPTPPGDGNHEADDFTLAPPLRTERAVFRTQPAAPEPEDADGEDARWHAIFAVYDAAGWVLAMKEAKAQGIGLAAPADRAVTVTVTDEDVLACHNAFNNEDREPETLADAMRRTLELFALRVAERGEDRRKISAGNGMDRKPDGGY